MKTLLGMVCFSVVACGGGQKSVTPTAPEPVAIADAPPPAPAAKVSTRRDDVVDTLHGVTIADPYRWLEKADDPSVKDWLAQQERAARAVLTGLAGRDKLAARMAQLTYIDSVTPPEYL
jgi:prolyl oligopeptidase